MHRLKHAITICFLFFYLGSTAQTYFGYRGGINFATLSTSEYSFVKNERRTGYNASLFFDFKTRKRLSIQPEVGIVQKGFKERKLYNSSTGLTYLDFAFLLKYNLKKKVNNKKKRKIINGYLNAGSSIGGLLFVRRKNLDKDEIESANKDFYTKATAGVLIGGGLNIPCGNGDIIFDLRYDMGVTDIDNGRISGGYLRNQNIMISVGHTFRIKR